MFSAMMYDCYEGLFKFGCTIRVAQDLRVFEAVAGS